MQSKLAFIVYVVSLALAGTALADLPTVGPVYDLRDGRPSLYGSIFDPGSAGNLTVPGDTYGADPLVQDATSAFYLSSLTQQSHVFDFSAEGMGNNLANSGSTFLLNEAESTLGSGNTLVQIQITSINASQQPTPWVAAGVAGPNGAFTAWRMDVGAFAALADKLAQQPPFAGGADVVGSGITVFNSAGTALGTFALAASSTDATGLDGVGLVGLGGADIAGFDLASFQMFWEVSAIPEPTGLISLGGLVGLMLIRRRR
jgi:hypothetical protein